MERDGDISSGPGFEQWKKYDSHKAVPANRRRPSFKIVSHDLGDVETRKVYVHPPEDHSDRDNIISMPAVLATEFCQNNFAYDYEVSVSSRFLGFRRRWRFEGLSNGKTCERCQRFLPGKTFLCLPSSLLHKRRHPV